MSNLLKYDFYKLIRSKSFYICAVISLLLSTLAVYFSADLYNATGYNLFKPYDSLIGISDGLVSSSLLIIIAIVTFIPSDFSFGTIKNMILGLPIIQIKQIIWENINTGKYVIQEE